MKVTNNEPEVSWRLGQDGRTHAIIGCDALASGWVAECGAFITGGYTLGAIDCNRCMDEIEKRIARQFREYRKHHIKRRNGITRR